MVVSVRETAEEGEERKEKSKGDGRKKGEVRNGDECNESWNWLFVYDCVGKATIYHELGR